MAQTVYVGLSGGVDSSVSAALLQAQGHHVVGVFIKIWQPTFLECTWREDRLDAMRVAAALGIPLRELDLSEEYRKGVIETMLRDYTRGITPNPDILCNGSIKFGAFFNWALKEGADTIATGHYAQTKEGRLYRAIDDVKDQSYFLALLTSGQLARVRFPVGAMHKAAVRAAALRLELPVTRKPDSQGLCFVGDVSMPEFLSRYIDLSHGSVLDHTGAVIGEHDGAALYTQGQRHGFRLFQSGAQQYVVRIDTKRNTITVSPDRDDAKTRSVLLGEPHWISAVPGLPLTCDAQPRYHGEVVRTTLKREDAAYRASFQEPVLATPGQTLVFYQDDECVGSATIASCA